MSILVIENLNHSFGDKFLFNKAECRLLKGEHIGLVGVNGAGKSTLMKLITRQVLPDGGSVTWAARAKYGYLEQHIDFAPEDTVLKYLENSFAELYELEHECMQTAEQMGSADEEQLDKLMNRFAHLQAELERADFYNIGIRIEEIAAGLGITDLGMETLVSRLIGGQRTKLTLARLLLQEPDVLLLDEPTNYLDDKYIDWLTGYLKAYKNAFIVISHDIKFLDEITNITFHLENKRINRYAGNYTKFKAAYELQKDQQSSAYQAQQKEIKKLETYIQKNIARASTAKSAQSRVKKLDKIERIEKPGQQARPNFKFPASSMRSSFVLEAEKLKVGYSKPLLPPFTVKMKPGDKIALVGYNGIGKSTTLKTLLGFIKPLDGMVTIAENVVPAYFAQEDTLRTTEHSALDEIWNQFPELTQKEVRAALARCGLTAKHIMQPLKTLSGGEQSKVRLCQLTMSKSNLLVLDEPTNHLDQLAQKALRDALIQYKGSIILVSHDHSFYEDWVSDVWNVENWAAKK